MSEGFADIAEARGFSEGRQIEPGFDLRVGKAPKKDSFNKEEQAIRKAILEAKLSTAERGEVWSGVAEITVNLTHGTESEQLACLHAVTLANLSAKVKQNRALDDEERALMWEKKRTQLEERRNTLSETDGQYRDRFKTVNDILFHDVEGTFVEGIPDSPQKAEIIADRYRLNGVTTLHIKNMVEGKLGQQVNFEELKSEQGEVVE
jgi:hypothetical protein